MFRFITCVIVVFVSISQARSQPALERGGLRTVTVIKSVETCPNDANYFSLILTLKARITNIASRPVIIERPGLPMTGMVSASIRDAHKKKYVARWEPYYVTTTLKMPAIDYGSPLASKDFIVLAPGEVYEYKFKEPVVARPARLRSTDLLPGRYFLQVELPTWTQSPEKALEVAKRWESFGILYTDTLLSEPMVLQIPANPNFQSCTAPR